MAKMHQVIGNASIDVEGDGEAIAWSIAQFHLAVAQHNLREVEASLSSLRPLQKNRRELLKTIERLKAKVELTPASIQ